MTEQTVLTHSQFTSDDVEIIKREELYRGFFRAEKVTLRHRLFEGGWSREMGRELFVRGPAVVVVVYDPRHDTIGLIEQFRIGAIENPGGPWCLEIVAGMIEEGEAPEDVARRELVEEAGIRQVELEYICQYLPSPGGSNEVSHVLCGLCDLSQVAGIHGLDDEHEDIKVHVIPAEQVFKHLYIGRFNNAATLIGLQWLQINRPRLRMVID